MSMHIPTTTQGWRLHKLGQLNPETDSLRWDSEIPLQDLGPTDVCVKLHAAALNFRDLASKAPPPPGDVSERDSLYQPVF